MNTMKRFIWITVAFLIAEICMLAFLIETYNQSLPEYLNRIIIALIVLSVILSLCFVLICCMYKKEHNKLQFKSNFIDYITHELKSPITIIRSCKDAIGMQTLDPQTNDLLKIITNETEVLGNFVQNILTIQQFDNHALKPHLKKMNIVGVVEKAVSQFNSINGNITIYDDTISEQAKLFVTDENMLIQIIDNLLSNSFKYCDQTPEVEIHITNLPNKIVISLSDNGIGIDIDERKLIFNKFYRTNTKEDVRGSGLGLYINTQLAQLINGKVYLSRSSSKGSEFIVELYNEIQ